MENAQLIAYYLLFLGAVFTVGNFCLRKFGASFANLTQKIVYSFSVGSVLYAYWFMLLGALNILYKPLFFLGYLIPFSVWLVHLFLHPEHSLELQQRARKAIQSTSLQTLAILTVLFVIILPLLGYLFLLPVSWDAVAYHLMLPKYYFEVHNLSFISWFPQTAFPMGVHAIFGFGEVIGDARFAAWYSFTCMMMLVAYIIFGLRHRYPAKVLLIAGLVFLFQPIVYSETGYAPGVEYPLALFAFLSISSLVEYFEDPLKSWLFLTVMLAAYTSIIKVSGLFVLISVVIFILGQAAVKLFFRPHYRLQLTKVDWNIVLASFVPSVYWYIKTWIQAHNPIYPFLNNVFKGFDYDPKAVDLLTDDIQKLNAYVSPMLKRYYHSAEFVTDTSSLAELVPTVLLLALAGVVVLTGTKKEKVLAAASLMIALPVIWIVGPLQRYYLLAVPGLAIVSLGLAFRVAEKFQKTLIVPAVVFLTLAGMFSLQIDATMMNREPLFVKPFFRVWLGFFDYKVAQQSLFVQDNHRVTVYANENLNPKTDKILQALDNRLYYLTIPAEYANPTLHGYFSDQNTASVDQLAARLKTAGFTHLIISLNWGIPPNFQKKVFQDFLVSRYVEPVFVDRNVTLYKLKNL